MRTVVALSVVALSLVLVACNRQPCSSIQGAGLAGGNADVPLGGGEGMWPLGLLSRLDEEELRRKGLQVPLETIWGESGGMAKAAIKLANGCSASFVSSDGLIFTNHHCAYGSIARNSTEEHNWLEEGFVAATRTDELPGHGLTVQVLRTFTDVTDRVLEGLPEDPSARGPAVDRSESQIVSECEQQPHTKCYVGRFLDGVPYQGEPDGRPRFFLFETTELLDVRVVAAPPESVGSYGGEIDNWHWPRHSGDFTVLRAYVAPDGSSAEYSESNVPYHPEVHLQVSSTGIGPGDFVMVMGYPWSTTRHLTAVEVEEQQEWYFPLRVNLFTEWSELLHAQSERSEQAAIHVAPHMRSIDNGLSHSRGRVEAFRNLDVLGERQRNERALATWIAGSPERQQQFGQVLSSMQSIVERRAATRERDILLRYLGYGSQLLRFARTIVKWAQEHENSDDLEREPGYQDRDESRLRSTLEHAQRSLDLVADRAVFSMLLRRAMALPEGQRIAPLDAAVGEDQSPERLEAFAQLLYDGSELGDQSRRMELFGQDLTTLQASEDSMIRLALEMSPILDEREELSERFSQELALLRPQLTLATTQSTAALLYPDATSTPRVSFGNVLGYSPREGMLYTPFTTVNGVVAKHTGEEPFNAPARLLEVAAASQESRWVDRPLGDVPACFLADIDTTGGNSGSPVIDGQGQLVGLLFDGVWEDLAGDITYSPRLSRSISVDVRFVLWLLEDVMGAAHIVEELELQ